MILREYKSSDCEQIAELFRAAGVAAIAVSGSMKTSEQTLVGFALETDNEEANAQRKLEKKSLDYIVLNSLRDKGAGFGVDTNKVTIIGRDGSREESPLLSKKRWPD